MSIKISCYKILGLQFGFSTYSHHPYSGGGGGWYLQLCQKLTTYDQGEF